MAEAVATSINLTHELMQGRSLLTPEATMAIPQATTLGTTTTEQGTATMTVAQLRKQARAAGQSRAWCRVARKAELLALLGDK